MQITDSLIILCCIMVGWLIGSGKSTNGIEAYKSQIRILENLLNQHANFVAQLINVKNNTQSYVNMPQLSINEKEFFKQEKRIDDEELDEIALKGGQL